MLRPSGWETPKVIALKKVKPGFVTADQVRFLTKEECNAFEAGADAMLRLLRDTGSRYEWYSITEQGDAPPLVKGVNVFIPDEVEK